MDQLSIRIQPQRHILVALGSNLSHHNTEPGEILPISLSVLAEKGLHVRSVSRMFRTPCFPAGAGPDYVNAAAVLESDLEPEALLSTLHEVESEFGRARVQRWGSRVLDLDLLAVDDTILPDRDTYDRWRDLSPKNQQTSVPDTLILPHPRMHERGFVLHPLRDVAPGWRHPVLGQTVAEMCAALPDTACEGIWPLN